VEDGRLNMNFDGRGSLPLGTALFGPVRRAAPDVVSAAPRPALLDAAANVAIVHDWFPALRGGERVVSEICGIVPNPEVFTLFDFLSDDQKREFFREVPFHTSRLNDLPKVERYYRALFFLCPIAIEQIDVTGHDAVISSSAAFARGVITRPDQPHLCYVHSPIRYAWDEQFSYLAQARLGLGPMGLLYRYLLHRLRMWDARTAHSPDLMLANSNYVRARIRRIYGRDAQVVFPPVSVDKLPLVTEKDDYYVAASFLAPYKRTDLVIEAFNRMPSRRLVVVGDGQQSKALRASARSNVTFTGYLPRQEYERTVSQARAMVFAGCEDFGIALAEAQACGTPLIAFNRGGAQDIVRQLGGCDMPTGVLFDRQNVEAVMEAVEHFESNRREIRPDSCRESALRFSADRFRQQLLEALDRTVLMHRPTSPGYRRSLSPAVRLT
jgi:glycosyltransferase involved in cell wall biosynthesis